jgi:hypothetical protein
VNLIHLGIAHDLSLHGWRGGLLVLLEFACASATPEQATAMTVAIRMDFMANLLWLWPSLIDGGKSIAGSNIAWVNERLVKAKKGKPLRKCYMFGISSLPRLLCG